MFRPTDRQRSLFETENQLSGSIRQRLKGSWAEGFAVKVLPVLLEEEEQFSSLYCEDNGRPNWSVARMFGLSLLQEYYDLDDQKALDCLAFDIRWQHALGLTPEESYLSRRSLVDFRSRLVAVDPEMKMVRSVFDRVGAAAIEDLGISVKEQRADSTLIASNIFTRGRIELFRKTEVHFLDWLSREMPDRLEMLSPFTRKWYEGIKEGGWFGKVDKNKVKQLLATLANRLYELVQTFSNDKEVKAAEPYQLVERLFNEHCELVEPVEDDTINDGQEDGHDDDGAISGGDGEPVKVKVRKKPESSGSSLQSPYDPDAGCSYKGPGYLTHVTETCNNKTAEIITDYDVTSAAETDRGKDAGIIDRLAESGKQPEILYEDGGYPTGQGIIDAEKKGTKIIAPMTGGRLPEDTIGRDRFSFDEETGDCARCPAGHEPTRHGMRSTYRKQPATLHAFFDGDKCRACEMQSKCVARGPNNGKKGSFHLEVGAHLIVRDEALAEQKNADWWNNYSIRAGVEATISELKRVNGLAKLRVRRMPRVLLAVGLKITACNVKRWLRASTMAERAAEQAQAVVSAAIMARDAFMWAILVVSRRTRAIMVNFAG